MKHLRFKLLPFILTLGIYACQDDEIIVDQGPLGDCLVNAFSESTGSDCADFPIDSSIICEVIVPPNDFPLKDNYKEWLPFFCGDPGTRYFYESEAGESTFIEVTDKRVTFVNSLQNAFDGCETNADKNNFYCINSEIATVSCSSPELELDFQIVLQSQFQRPLSLPLKRGALIVISSLITQTMDVNLLDFVTHFRSEVVQDELTLIQGSNFSFFDEIDIFGTSFKEVHTYQSLLNDKAIQFFYNQELGIVSFIGDDGTQWKIKN